MKGYESALRSRQSPSEDGTDNEACQSLYAMERNMMTRRQKPQLSKRGTKSGLLRTGMLLAASTFLTDIAKADNHASDGKLENG